MEYRVYPSLSLAVLFFLFSAQVLATHAASEPTDGTVNSFRWVETPVPVSDVQIQDGDGNSVSLTQFKGKIVLLNLWASWCPPCIRELPALDRLQQRLGGEDFVVLAVSLDRDPQLAKQMFNDRLALQHLTLYLDPAKQLGNFFPVDVLPATFFIDREGQGMSMLRSYVDWDDPQADSLIRRLIAGVGSAALRAEKAHRDQAQAK